MSYSGYDSYGQAEPQITFSDAGSDVASAFKATGSDQAMGSKYYRAEHTPELYGKRLNYAHNPSITQTTNNVEMIDLTAGEDDLVGWDQPLPQAAATPAADPDPTEEEGGAVAPDSAEYDQATSLARQYSNTTLDAAHGSCLNGYSESVGGTNDLANYPIAPSKSPFAVGREVIASNPQHASDTYQSQPVYHPCVHVDPSAYPVYIVSGSQGGAGSSRQPGSGSHLPLRRPHGQHRQSHQGNRRNRHGAR